MKSLVISVHANHFSPLTPSTPSHFSFIFTIAPVEPTHCIPAMKPILKVKIWDEESLTICSLQQGWSLFQSWMVNSIESPAQEETAASASEVRKVAVCGPGALGLGKVKREGYVQPGLCLLYWPWAHLGDPTNFHSTVFHCSSSSPIMGQCCKPRDPVQDTVSAQVLIHCYWERL